MRRRPSRTTKTTIPIKSDDIPGPKPLDFVYRESRAHQPTRGSGGVITIDIPSLDPTSSPERIEIELYHRPGYPRGIQIRTLDTALDIEPHVGNTIIVKPRVRVQ